MGSAQKTAIGHKLTVNRRPDFEAGATEFRVADLFSGCGGLSLGMAQACFESGIAFDVALAVDFEKAATSAYSANFPKARNVMTAGVESIFDGPLGTEPTELEIATRARVGHVDALVGGPPCQGHSNLNNHTRRNDPKNNLYLYMVRAAEVLRPDTVLVENVPAILNDRHNGQNVVARAIAGLKNADYVVASAIVSLYDLGVAQTRKRHILIASKSDAVNPEAILKAISEKKTHRDLRWAIGDLADARKSPLDDPPQAKEPNLKRMRYLLENDLFELPNELRPTCHQGNHSYKSMYGRLSWSEPAQTITSGFGSIGQGRYMHPERARALTAHEAARIQGFPDYFTFDIGLTRSALAVMIGNAVPPQLARRVFGEVLRLRANAGATSDCHSEAA